MSKTLRQAIFLHLGLFFMLGIIIQSHYDLSCYWIYIAGVSFLFLCTSFIPQLTCSYNWRWLFGFGLSLLCFSSAGILTHIQWEASEWHDDDKIRDYQVQIIDEPVKKPKTWMCKIAVNGQKAIVYIPSDSISSTLWLSDWLTIRTLFEKTDLMFLRKQGIAARAFVGKNQWGKLENPPKQTFNLRFHALKCRRALLNRLREIIPDDKAYSIAAAILFGYVNDLDADLRNTFSATGSAHILSVSGLHFSIVYGILYFLLSFLGKSKKEMLIRQLIILPMMWIFAFLTGLGPTVIRSAIMLSVWGIGNAFLFKAFTINTLGVAAFFMLLYNPLNLFDVGFQLSFSAVFAILVINPYLVKLHKSGNPVIKYVWELSCVSTSAQLGTAPLSIYYFHQFPLIYLVTNLFAIPLTGILMGLIPVSLVLQSLFGNHIWLMSPVNKLLTFFISGLEKLEKIPNGLIENISLDEKEAICMLLFIVLIVLLWMKKRIIYGYLLILLVLLQVFYYLCTF
jgi:competence protein ComEC